MYREKAAGFMQKGSEGGWRTAHTAAFKKTAGELCRYLKFYDVKNKLKNRVRRSVISSPARE